MSFGRQITHVFAGDLRRFWPLLILMVGILLAHRVVGLPLDPIWSLGVRGGVGLFPILYAAITVLVVQHHSVIDDRGFWNVRPIGPGAILGAKLLFVGLFLCAVPVALQVEWLLAMAGGGDARGAAFDSALYQASFLALIALGAAITRNVVDFLTLALVMWVAVSLAGHTGEPRLGIMGESVTASRAWLMRWSWLTIGLVGLLGHYRFRRAPRAIGAGALSLLLAAGSIQRMWVDLVPPIVEPVGRFTYASSEAVTVRMPQLTASTHSDADATATIGAALIFDGLTGRFPRLHTSSSVLSGRSGAPLNAQHPSRASSPLTGFPLTAFMSMSGPPIDGARQVGSKSTREVPPTAFALVASGPRERVDHLSDELPVELRLDVSADIYEPRFARRVPLEPSVHEIDGGVLEIERVERSDGSVLVTGYFSAPARALRGRFALRQEGLLAGAVLYNEARSEYLSPRGPDVGRGQSRAPAQYLVPGSSLEEFPVSWVFDGASGGRNATPIPDGWFQGVELAFVEPAYVGTLKRTLTRTLREWPDVDGRPAEVDSR